MKLYPEYKIVKQSLLGSPEARCIGCFLRNGVAIPAFRAQNSRAKMPCNMLAVGSSAAVGRVIGYGTDKKVYLFKTNNAASVQTSLTGYETDSPFFIEYIDHDHSARTELILFAGTKFLRYTSDSSDSGDLNLSLSCGAIRSGRLFGASAGQPYTLVWSAFGDPLDWTSGIDGSGSLNLGYEGGKILDVFDFENRLAVLREYGVTLIAASSAPEDFRVIKHISTPAVAKSTGKVAAGRLVFWTDEGLYSCAGGKAERLDNMITADAESVTAAYCYLGRYYVCAGTSRHAAGGVVYIFNAETGECSYLEAEGTSFGCDSVSLIAYGPLYSYRIGFGGKYTLYCGEFTFGTPARKLLTAIDIVCDGKVTAEYHNGTYSGTFKLEKGHKRLNIRCGTFSVSLSSEEPIYSAELYAEVRN